MENLQKMKAEGVRSVINLRLASEYNFEEEASTVKKLDLRYFHIPVDKTNLKDEQVQKFLEVTGDPGNLPHRLVLLEGFSETVEAAGAQVHIGLLERLPRRNRGVDRDLFRTAGAGTTENGGDAESADHCGLRHHSCKSGLDHWRFG